MRFLGLLTIIFIWSTATGQSACFNNCVTPPSCAEMGYRLESEIFCPNGAITCPFDKRYKWCKEYKCEDGRYYNSADEAGGEKGYKCDQVNYHGRDCFDCYCSPNPSECKWTEKNKGEGKISEICCDGTYASCESTCTDTVKVPEHAHGLKEACIGCGEEKEIITKWECDDWYDPKGEGCYARPCDEGYSTAWKTAEDCGQTGSDGWRWETNEHYSGADLCGICIEKQCLAGFGTDKTDAASCGTEKGWKWEKSAQYAGDEICARCTCSAPSTCVWHSGEEGTGTLSDPCCDGSYTTCRSTCEEDAAPNNATCDSRCTGCQKEVCTKWHCNSGWYKENKECHENACEGYAASAEGCGSGSCKANGWSVNTTTCQRGGTTTYQCVKKDCPTGSDTSYSDAKNCGKQGANGWTSTPSSSCNGDDKCYTCTAKQCAEGYGTDKKDVTSCGTSGATGWDWSQSGFSGDAPCGKCTPKTCPANSAVDVKDCGSTGGDGYSLGGHAGWNGESECKKCEPLQCLQNTATTEAGCGNTGTKGWKLGTATERYNGQTPCKNCIKLDCPTDSKTEWSDATKCGRDGSKGGWTSIGTDHYNGQAQCFTCAKKPCANGFNTDKPNVQACGQSGDSGWTWQSQGYSGDDVCGKCTAKACEGFGLSSCPAHGTCTQCQSGDTVKHKLSSCAKGWHIANNECVEDSCDGYTLKTCPDHGSCGTCQKGATLMYKLNSCNSGWTMGTNTCVMNECSGYAASAAGCGSSTCGASGWSTNSTTCQKGDTKTYQCVKKNCPTNEKTEYSDVKNCGTQGSKGWTNSATTSCNGDVRCYKCAAKNCPSGTDTSSNTYTICKYPGTVGAKKTATGEYSGDSPCYKCECNASSTECKWTDQNKGEASLSQQCCNGNYKTCTSKCKENKAPANATCTSECKGCDKTVCTAWKCNTGYTQSGSTCTPAQCPTNYDTKYQTKTDCGNESGWSVSFSGKSGETNCGKCVCTPASNCKWNNTNKGIATLDDPCCDGNYAKCTSTCGVGKIAPLNGKCTKWCKSCDNADVCVEWGCNSGYHKNSANTGCEPDCTATCASEGLKTSRPTCQTGETTTTRSVCGTTCYTNCTCTSPCSDVSIPAHAYGTSTTSACGKTCYTNWACNNGYTKSGSSCTANACTGYSLTSCPQNGTCSTCLSGTTTKYSLDSCKNGYTKSGNSCIVASCPSGSGTTLSDCGSHTSGWELGAATGYYSGSSACKKCNAKSCPSSQSTSNSTSTCGSGGWNRVTSGSYSGDSACYKCEAKSCPSGETTSSNASNCGTTGTSGWTRTTSGSYAGSSACYKCTAKSCPSGYSTSYSSASSCSSTGCWNFSSSGYSGNSVCGKCTSGGTSVSIPANGYCSNTVTCNKGSYCSSWACNNGYTKSGSSCTANACTGYSLTSCPQNGTCSTCLSGTTTKYSLDSCKNGYTKSGNSCVRHDSGCSANTPPTNGKCDSYCYSYGSQVCKSWSCNSGYTQSGSSCVRHDSGCSKVTIPSHASCSSYCYSYGSSVCKNWSCNSGYHASGNTCVPDCTATCASEGLSSTKPSCKTGETYSTKTVCSTTCYSSCTCTSPCTSVSIPANAHGTTSKTSCGKTCYTAWACDTGYTQSGSSCVRHDSGCTSVTVPAIGAECSSHCYSNGSQVCSAWKCKSGYKLSGSSCVLDTCSSGYSTTKQSVSDCGSTGSNGWTFTSNGTAGGKTCGKCTAKSCPTGTKTAAQCSTQKFVDQSCVTTGAAKGYAGNEPCYTCKCTSLSTDCCALGYGCTCAGKCSNECGGQNALTCFQCNTTKLPTLPLN